MIVMDECGALARYSRHGSLLAVCRRRPHEDVEHHDPILNVVWFAS